MSAANNGGPAFPCKEWVGSDSPVVRNPTQHPGMTLRDYFAAHAPFSLADARGVFHEVHGNYKKPSGDELLKNLVDLLSSYATSMLAAWEAK